MMVTKQTDVIMVISLAVWLFCSQPVLAANPLRLETWSEFDVAVEVLYENLTNSTLPCSVGSCQIAAGYYLFPPDSEIASATNRFIFSPRMGVPVWRARIIETQGVDRLWLYQGNNGACFRSNSVPVSFDPELWINDVYGESPLWLNAGEEELWHNQRDRSRFAITISLVASNNWALLEDAGANLLTNSSLTETGRVAFVDMNILPEQYLSLQLYAPTNPMPIEIYSSAELPTNGLWSFAGLLNAAGPVDSWHSSKEGRAFFIAAQGNVDSDADGIPDGREVLTHGTDPVLADSDSDGLSDRAELYQYETDPGNPDCDDDTIPDGWEVSNGMNPYDAADITEDPDDDHLYNLHEYWINSDPRVAQTNSYAIIDSMKSVDLSITGLVVGASINIFSTQDHSNTNYLRDTNCWAYAYDLTCCSPWNSYTVGYWSGNHRAGTLISPRHVIFAAHYDDITTNDTLRFVDINNNVIERRLVAKKRHPDYPGASVDYPYPDFTVGLLESDLPTNQISFAKVLPDDYREYIGAGRFLPSLCLDQEEKALIADLVDIAQTNFLAGIDQLLTVFDYPVDTNRLNYSEEIIVGDSGNPAFLIIESQLVLLSVWTYGAPGAGTSITAFKDDINQLMTFLGGEYQLTEIDLSGFILMQ